MCIYAENAQRSQHCGRIRSRLQSEVILKTNGLHKNADWQILETAEAVEARDLSAYNLTRNLKIPIELPPDLVITQGELHAIPIEREQVDVAVLCL